MTNPMELLRLQIPLASVAAGVNVGVLLDPFAIIFVVIGGVALRLFCGMAVVVMAFTFSVVIFLGTTASIFRLAKIQA